MAIDKQTALEIAKAECEKNGWPWPKQVSVKWGLTAYTVWGGGRKGGNLCIRIRKMDGALLSSNVTPR